MKLNELIMEELNLGYSQNDLSDDTCHCISNCSCDCDDGIW